MVKIELYVPGLKRKDMTDIAYLDIAEGSRGIRYRAYGTYTDPNTNKIHKVNSFISKDVYDKTMAEMTVGMPIDDMIVERVEVFAEDSVAVSSESPLEDADLTGIIVQDNDPSSPPEGIFASDERKIDITNSADTVGEQDSDGRVTFCDDDGKGSACEESYCHRCNPLEGCTTHEKCQEIGRFEADDRVTRPDAFDKVYNAIDVLKSNNLTVTLQAVGNELHDDGYMTNDEKEAFYYIIDQKNLDLMGLSLNDSPVIIDEEVEERVRPEPGTWAAIALDMVLAGDMTPEEANHWKDEMKEKGFDAEMTLREWGESELEEPKHDFSENPNESFREWIDEEVKAHGDVSFKDWADEEEHDEPTTVTKSAETDTNRETQNTQIAVAIGVPPDIWLNMSINRQNEYITSMELDVIQIREWAQLGEFQLIMDLANNQKEVSTAGDLSLIECNVCGISAAQLLDGLGGVCDITDPNGGANPDYLRGVSCPFEKYYSLTRAVYNAVEDELKENRTVIQLITPRSVAYAAESNNSAKPSNLSHIMNRFKGQKLSFHSPGETLMKSDGIKDHKQDNITLGTEIDNKYIKNMEKEYLERHGSYYDELTGWKVLPGHKREAIHKKKMLQDEMRSNGGWYLLDGDWEDDYEEALIADKDGNTMEIRWYFDISQFRDNKVGKNPKWDGGLDYNFNFDYFNPKGMVEWRDTDGKLLAQAPFTKMEKIPLDKKVEKIAETLGADALMNITKDTSLDSFTPTELTESSAIHGDFEHASLNFSGGQNIQARAETFNSDSWDDLYVVAENQMGGWKACQVTDGVLQTYSNQADAESEAQMTINELNSMYDWDSNHMELEEGQVNYDEDSWAGKRLSEVDIADNVKFIEYPNGLKAPYPPGRSSNTGYHLEATRGIDTFTEPFEEDKIAGTYECYCSYCAGVVELDADECPHCGTVDFDITDGGRVNYPSYSVTDADYKCSCETPRPRNAGIHPTVCQGCNQIIEDNFGAESEDCEVCHTTVDKGTLNDVQAGRICNECHRMNQYAGGTRTIKTPYNAEIFEATKGIDTFTEPFEEDSGKSHLLPALGIVGAAVLAYMFLPKGE